ncbi:MAG: hypothetical protein ACREDD_05450 [Methylocella sp.]
MRAADSFRRGGKEAAQEAGNRLDPILARLFRLAFEIVGKGDDFAPVDLAVLDPDELQIVRQKNVARQRLVALDLIRLQSLIEVFADGLVLDIAEDHPSLHRFEIRPAFAGSLFCLVDDVDAWVRLTSRFLQESFKRAPVGKLGFVAAVLPQRKQINFETMVHGN